MKITKILAALLCLALLFGLAACGLRPTSATGPNHDEKPTQGPGNPQGGTVKADPLAAPRQAESYDAVLQLLCQAGKDRYGFHGRGEIAVDDAAVPNGWPKGEPTEEPTSPNGPDGNDGAEDTGTNIQVAGVDEADIVKTADGYIYCLTGDSLIIYRAAGAETERVSETRVGSYDEEFEGRGWPQAMLIGSDRVAVILSYSSYGINDDGDYYDLVLTRVLLFDVSDKAAPQLIAEDGADGYYQTARLMDGKLYLITTKFTWAIDEDTRPENYVPCVYADGVKTMLAPDEIWICPHPSSTALTAVTSVDLQSGAIVDKLAFTDNTETVYMDRECIYLARPVTTTGESEPYTEDQYTVVDYEWVTRTEIKRIRVDSGKLTLDGSAEVEGAPLNQFCLDVYEGNLRIATTVTSESYRIFTDEKHGWTNYEHVSGGRESRVTVLDGDLKQIGLLTGLGEEERIYSVRFMGNMAYIVTFRETDPVFTVDLSDPTKPTLEGELKLPGVSKYLHLVSDGRLFGFGQAIEEQGLQLTLFDVSDPKNVTVVNQLNLEEFWGSEGEYDHKALMMRPDLGLIGFCAYGDEGESYVLVRCENDALSLIGSVELGWLPNNARGIVLDGVLYICGGSVLYAVSPEDLTVLASLSDAEG